MPSLLHCLYFGYAGVLLYFIWRFRRVIPYWFLTKCIISGFLLFFLMSKLGPALFDYLPTPGEGNLDTPMCSNGQPTPFTPAFVFLIMVGGVIILALLWVPTLTSWIGQRAGAMFNGEDSGAVLPTPVYSIAISRRLAHKYREALWEIQQQLEKFPNDFEGQLLLATIQAEDLRDLPAAQISIERILNQSGHRVQDVALALTQLAKWQQWLVNDTPAACRSFERIVQMYPGTRQAEAAFHQLNRLREA